MYLPLSRDAHVQFHTCMSSSMYMTYVHEPMHLNIHVHSYK